jgi:signal transduction histidine kinase
VKAEAGVMPQTRKSTPVNPLSQIINSLASGTIALDQDGRVIVANPAAARTLEVPESALGPGCLFEKAPGVEPLLEVIREVSRSGEPVSRREITLASPGGSAKVLGLTASLLEGPAARNGVILIFADLTEVRKLEEIARLNRQLAEVGELTAGVVHELRNPLSVISGLCELVLRRTEEASPSRRHLETVLEEVAALNQVITHFLSFAKPFDLSVAPVGPGRIVARAVQLVSKKAAERQVRVRAEEAENLSEIRADAAKLAHAVANLIINAIEIVAADGSGEVSVAVVPCGEQLVFRVEYNGPGIQLRENEDLFSPFRSYKEGGTGLGLSIVHRIVTAHGGEARYGNREAGGAWF